jgi:hypothetical protein
MTGSQNKYHIVPFEYHFQQRLHMFIPMTLSHGLTKKKRKLLDDVNKAILTNVTEHTT